MKKLLIRLFYIGMVLGPTACREPFAPDFKTGVNDFLVVEGYIDVGEKAVTKIILSRISPLSARAQNFEKGSMVVIEGAGHELFELVEKEEGKYFSDSLNLDPTIEYRLLIKTSKGNEFVSEYVKPKITPAVDSLHWRQDLRGVTIYVDTHDPTNSSHYYKWTFEETWEIHSAYRSRYFFDGEKMKRRRENESLELFQCWSFGNSKDLHIGSSAQYQNDAISFPLINHSLYSERMSVKYSMRVAQRTLSQDEFNYLQLVQKNTTVTGSLFDPMPSEIRGNIISVSDPDELVIGFVGAYTTSYKRFFIHAYELGPHDPAKCDTELIGQDDFTQYFVLQDYIPVDSIALDPMGKKIFSGALKYCMDCSLRGTPVRPEYFTP